MLFSVQSLADSFIASSGLYLIALMNLGSPIGHVGSDFQVPELDAFAFFLVNDETQHFAVLLQDQPSLV